ncbi:MAG: heme NO-binding domain-containing protein [Myxococcota bacterium]
MKGIVFNLLESYIVSAGGQSAYDDILAKCKLQTSEPFVGPGTYPDSDFMEMVVKAAEHLNISLPNAVRGFGRFCFPRLASKFSTFVTPFENDPKGFLKTIDNVIHVEVRKLYRDAITPEFVISDTGPNQLLMAYSSPRKLCIFAEGLLDGVGDYFKKPLQYTQATCMHEGAPACNIEIQFL